ncbi:MAG: DUF1704 domain-containing protein [bacterium]|nr:DUF1704 domain-containing protein [bacterium]
MTKTKVSPKHYISEKFIKDVIRRLNRNEQIRRSLPEKGRINIDRQLPFLVLYRQPYDRWDAGTSTLVVGEASYIIVSSHAHLQKGFKDLIYKIISNLTQEFGSYIIIEVWSSAETKRKRPNRQFNPAAEFKIHSKKKELYSKTLETFEKSLKSIRIFRKKAKVYLVEGEEHPPYLDPILSAKEARLLNCHLFGLEVKPIYRDNFWREEFPLVLQALHRSLSKVFKRTFFAFSRSETLTHPPSYRSLGKRSLVKAVWETDGRLAKISDSFDLLTLINPINLQQVKAEFKKSHFKKVQQFVYPRIPVDPYKLKENLYSIPIDKIEDPFVAEIFQEKRRELDLQLTLLLERGSKRFLYGSMELMGVVDDSTYDVARQILKRYSKRTKETTKGQHIETDEFSALAKKEISKYRRRFKGFKGTVEIREDVTSLMVSNGVLFIGKKLKIPKPRAQALLHHEVGTHMVTYYNALSQPFRLLHSGLAGYDSLQEGLGVLAEYLSGGLTRGRLRLLAGRVVATQALVQGAEFSEVCKMLMNKHNFGYDVAFTISLRIFRGGGLTKDALYLKGLMDLLAYVGKGGRLKPLFLGKFALKHMEFIEELLLRKVLHDPPLKPYYLKQTQSKELLEKIRGGATVLNLIKRNQP